MCLKWVKALLLSEFQRIKSSHFKIMMLPNLLLIFSFDSISFMERASSKLRYIIINISHLCFTRQIFKYVVIVLNFKPFSYNSEEQKRERYLYSPFYHNICCTSNRSLKVRVSRKWLHNFLSDFLYNKSKIYTTTCILIFVFTETILAA